MAQPIAPCAPVTWQSPPSARLFLALWPDEAARRALRVARDAIAWPAGAAPVADAKLHLTLHFIGAVPRARVEGLADALAASAPGLAPPTIDLALDRTRLWPRGLVVLCPARAPAALAQLHAGLGRVLAGQGLPVESRAYRPHVTLARDASATNLPQRAAPLHWRADGFSLVESAPGGRYVVLRRYAGDLVAPV